MGDVVVVDDEDFNDEDFLDELFRATDNAVASRNPNPTTAPTSISISHLPAASASASTSLHFTPPRELTQRPPLPRPSAASRDGEAMAIVGREFSPPRDLSQRPAAEESDLSIVAPSGPADGRVGTKRERETRELERLKRELSRVNKLVNNLMRTLSSRR